MDRVKGKTAIVTGAAGGIGRAVCKLLAQEGAKVALTDLRDQNGKNVVQQINDSGGIADATGGNQGHSVGIGPMVTWSGKVQKTPVSAALRWVNEFNTSNRPKGNAVQLSVNATFQ